MADEVPATGPETTHSPPRQHVNFAGAHGSATELALTLGYKEGGAQPALSSLVTVSWEFVPILIQLLQTQLDQYEENVGPVRDIQALLDKKEGSK